MLDLSEEQRMLVEETHRLATEEFADRAFTWEDEAPRANVETLADHGFLGINLDPAYGGGGMSEFDVALQVETIGRICPDTAAAVYSSSMVAPRAVDMFGSEAVKERYLPKLTDGELAMSIAISEPEAGSDSQSMVTTVEEADDGELYLNGEKTWVSHVEYADVAVVWAKFPGEGLGTVVVEFDQPGVEIQQHYTNMHGGTQTHFYLEDVHVPRDHVLVRGPDALKEQLKALNWERCGSSMLANSIALNAFDKAVEYAKTREQFGQPIGDFQGLRWKVADMATRLASSRSQTYRAALSGGEDGTPDRLQTAMAKLHSSETVERVVSEALQIHGANGYQQGHPLEYLYRLARGRRIAAGTDEIQKNNVADVAFDRGLPRVP